MKDLQEKIKRLESIYEAEQIKKNPYLINKILRMIDLRYDSISLNGITRELNFTPSYLSRAVSSFSGCTYGDYLMSRRIMAFCGYCLSFPENTIEKNALLIGYSSVHRFSKAFKQFSGISPRHVRQVIHNILYLL